MLYLGASLVAQTVKCQSAVRETWVRSLGWEDPLEKEMTTHSSTLAWKIPWTEEPGRLQSKGFQRVGHNWVTSLSLSSKDLSRRDSLSDNSEGMFCGGKGEARIYRSFCKKQNKTNKKIPQVAFLVDQTVKQLPARQETQVWSLDQEDPLEKEMATHSSILAWKIPWTEEPSGL